MAAAPSYQVRMAMRIMLWTGLRVSNARPSGPRTSGSPRTRPFPAKPRRPRREDYEYQWAGTPNLFLTCEPRRGWRYVAVTRQCTMQDFAHQMRCLLQRGQCPPAFVTFADVSLPAVIRHARQELFFIDGFGGRV